MYEETYLLAGIFIGIIAGAIPMYRAWKQQHNMHLKLLKRFEKSRVNLYTFEMAQQDIHNRKIAATPASILKWSKIANGLSLIKAVIGAPCGLCIKYSEPDCSICPLFAVPGEKCHTHDSTYQTTRRLIDDVYQLSIRMTQILKKV